MTDPPGYPRSDDDQAVESEPETGGPNTKLVVAGVIGLVVVIVILHLTGVVGPGAG